MKRAFRTIALVMLAWLPLQAAALPVLALKCHAGSAGPAAAGDHAANAAMHDHTAHAQQAAVDAGASGAPDDGGPAGHLCCTHFTAVTATVFQTVATTAAAAMATPAPRAYSHLPEPPQQPPRATPL